jgi:hypothetical protein
VPAAAIFSTTERTRIVQFWNEPGRYDIGVRVDAQGSGPFVVRLTPEASIWFHAFNRLLKPEALPPTQNAPATILTQSGRTGFWPSSRSTVRRHNEMLILLTRN